MMDDRLEKAIIAAIRPVPTSQSDSKITFWNAYKKVADEHDAEFQEKYKGDLNTSLIFVSQPVFISSCYSMPIIIQQVVQAILGQ